MAATTATTMPAIKPAFENFLAEVVLPVRASSSSSAASPWLTVDGEGNGGGSDDEESDGVEVCSAVLDDELEKQRLRLVSALWSASISRGMVLGKLEGGRTSLLHGTRLRV